METFGRHALSIYEGALGRFLSIIMEHWDEDARNSGDNTLAVWNAVVRGVVAIRTRGMSPSRKPSIITSKPFNLLNGVREPGQCSLSGIFRKTFILVDFFSCRTGLRFRRGSGGGLCANANGAPSWMIDFERICLSYQIA